jgi:deoxyribodipyrimidine photolyase-like uncharacterized protein
MLNHPHHITYNTFLIQQVDIFDVAIIEHKIKDIVIMNFAGFIRAIIAWFI